MTNHWTDIANSDCILIIGSNAAENHPLSFKWVMKAVEKGATLISVDPRFTRTSSKAHIYAPMRSGTDIAFMGGMMNYILSKKKYQEDLKIQRLQTDSQLENLLESTALRQFIQTLEREQAQTQTLRENLEQIKAKGHEMGSIRLGVNQQLNNELHLLHHQRIRDKRAASV